MEAKEKAKELVEIFGSKKTALICVNNIIAANPHSNPFNTSVYSTMYYWLEVEKEIETLK